jgi:DNA polymerase zeta
MVRLARSQNLLALSPNRDQVARQPATEALPLVLEPESRFYSDPVVVLDFQSLYPSLVIAYNLCYTTCVGRPAHLAAALDAQQQAAARAAKAQDAAEGAGGKGDGGARTAAAAAASALAEHQLRHLRASSSTKGGLRLGVSTYLPPTDAFLPGGPADPRRLVVAPNGVAYVPAGGGGGGGGGGLGGGGGGDAGLPGVPGVLPRMLHEILATRVMVKAALKRASKPATDPTTGGAPASPAAAADAPRRQRALQRQLNARQFGLKMIANVTYGYTSASFSGRMPCAELADSIVSLGRATLEAAIRLVEGHAGWRAKVVYGDTDSLFVLLPGRSRADAFAVGAEIAAAVTAANPRPVRLRMEKVYHPCVLQTKKRYVGAMYESPQQTKFSFDAKGIETVRRDACPATAKMLEAALRVMFATGGDLSRVRRYCERQWAKINAGRVSVQDFVFWREVRGPGGYAGSGSALPPAAAVAADMARRDPRAEPRPGERVPYVVVCGPPQARLVETAVPPRALVEAGWVALSAAGAGPPPVGYPVDGLSAGSGAAAAGGWLLALGASAAGAAAASGQLRLNAGYYITRQIIPALERVFALAGADVRAWYAAAPSAASGGVQQQSGGGGGGGGGGAGSGSSGLLAGPSSGSFGGGGIGVGRMLPQKRPAALLAGMVAASGAGGSAAPAAAVAARGAGIDAYFSSRHCIACDSLTKPNAPLCDRCRHDRPQAAAATLQARVAVLRRRHAALVRLCLHCGGGGGDAAACGPGGVVCDSLDCGVFYERRKALMESTTLALLTGRALEMLERELF